ncbi:MAG: hypothetical protein U9R38_04780 [Candidatus Margulisiibacteriota bacterium]|nr:hypothetical protein [Candidatus Margulisiibacteriota bacterium]
MKFPRKGAETDLEEFQGGSSGSSSKAGSRMQRTSPGQESCRRLGSKSVTLKGFLHHTLDGKSKEYARIIFYDAKQKVVSETRFSNLILPPEK